MQIFAVLREKGGAHESQDVMSIWSEQELADAEAERLNESASTGYKCTVMAWELNIAGDVINW